MTFTFTNFADSKVQSGIASTSSQVTIASAQADLFATFTATGGETQRAVIYDGVKTPELVDISLRAAGVLDITRAVESTTAQDWAAGSVVRGVLTAGMMAAAARVIGGTANEIDVTNGDGLTGTTLVALASELDLASKTVANANIISGEALLSSALIDTLNATELTVGATALFNGQAHFASQALFDDALLSSDGVFTFGGSASQGHEIRLREDSDNGTNYFGMKAPDTLATSIRIEFPSIVGSANQILEIASLSTDTIPLLTLQWADNTSLGSDWDDMEEFSAYQLGLGG